MILTRKDLKEESKNKECRSVSFDDFTDEAQDLIIENKGDSNVKQN